MNDRGQTATDDFTRLAGHREVKCASSSGGILRNWLVSVWLAMRCCCCWNADAGTGVFGARIIVFEDFSDRWNRSLMIRWPVGLARCQ